MMTYKTVHTTRYTYSEPVPTCHNQVHLAIRETPHQNCEFHRLLIQPVPAGRGHRFDYFGNQVDYFSIHDPHRGLTVTATSRVRVTVLDPPMPSGSSPWERVAQRLRTDLSPGGLDAYQFIFDSPGILCGPPGERVGTSAPNERCGELSTRDLLVTYAREVFTRNRPILEAARDLTAKIHADFTYDPTATTISTSLQELFRNRRGICQDFAHFEIACLRSLGLAARYVSGYLRTDPPPGRPRLVGADASHAWISIYAGELGWIDFDPTNNVIPAADHITLAWGRDYTDVCPIKGVFVGGGQHGMSVSVDVSVC